jgi:hypothetical protein
MILKSDVLEKLENVHLSVIIGQDDRSSADSISGIDIGSGFGQKSNLKMSV